MTKTKIIAAEWYPDERLLVTNLSGDINEQDVDAWDKSLYTAFEKIPSDGAFKIFVNLHGFRASDINAHKKYRSIIPLQLASYGWRIGYLDLFEEANQLKLSNTRGIQCTGAAHCHQDESKMNLYETKFSSTRERYFTDPEKALAWIEQLP